MAKEQEVENITVSGRQVGIVRLRSILQEVASLKIDDENRITAQLIERIRAYNYIPDSAEAEYGQALLRAYREYCGHATGSEDHAGAGTEAESGTETGLLIRILGPGCSRCEGLTREVTNALAELGLAADVEHVRDPEAIAKYGFLGTPALIINGRVRSSGRVPSRKKIKLWLQELC
jgi:small redox-active disulfide protein 2